ncbi:MAG: hypothetical protein F4X54_04120 [Chloroflexi bacterium]|nr:hypothetical protein [Chloroflexota bacterium]
MYSPEDLMEKRLTFLRENKPRRLRELRKSGELQAHLEESAERCKRTAESIMRTQPVPDSQAWSWAIRSELLEREWD